MGKIEDMPLEEILPKDQLAIPDIASGDLVMIRFAGGLLPDFFVSNGRVCQPDVRFDNKWLIENIEVPKPQLLCQHLAYTAVDEAIRRGYLKDFLLAFGRDQDVFEENAIAREYDMVFGEPTVFFGYNPNYAIALFVTLGSQRIFLNREVAPNPYTKRNEFYLGYKVKDVKEVIVGQSDIQIILREEPIELSLGIDSVFQNDFNRTS